MSPPDGAVASVVELEPPRVLSPGELLLLVCDAVHAYESAVLAGEPSHGWAEVIREYGGRLGGTGGRSLRGVDREARVARLAGLIRRLDAEDDEVSTLGDAMEASAQGSYEERAAVAAHRAAVARRLGVETLRDEVEARMPDDERIEARRRARTEDVAHALRRTA